MMVKLKSPDAFFIQVDVQFATEYGINEAIVAGKLLRLMGKLAGATDDAGAKWIRLTLAEWQQEIPFMSEMTIRRTAESLEKKTIMLTRTFAGRSKWYRLNPDFVDDNTTVQNEQIPPKNEASVQNEQFDCSNCTDTTVQNEQLPIILPRDSSNMGSAAENRRPPTILAYKIFVEETKKTCLNLPQIKAINEAVGNDPAALDKWRETVRAWNLQGNKLSNAAGMLDWFSTGKRSNYEPNKFRNGGATEPPPVVAPPLDDAKRAAYLKMLEADRAAAAESTARVSEAIDGIHTTGVDVQREIKQVQRRLRQ